MDTHSAISPSWAADGAWASRTAVRTAPMNGVNGSIAGLERDQVREQIAVAVDAFDHVGRQERQVVG